ncbi:hypothetical protein AURDEDRAFT_125210 [Auricularia subglabra TFB-10046 SS5]|nr:hypothetical protein AURDEDRAFT_125210 [Auricularia subglabra TFB-10046 SS5]
MLDKERPLSHSLSTTRPARFITKLPTPPALKDLVPHAQYPPGTQCPTPDSSAPASEEARSACREEDSEAQTGPPSPTNAPRRPLTAPRTPDTSSATQFPCDAHKNPRKRLVFPGISTQSEIVGNLLHPPMRKFCYGGCQKSFTRTLGLKRHWGQKPECKLQHDRALADALNSSEYRAVAGDCDGFVHWSPDEYVPSGSKKRRA